MVMRAIVTLTCIAGDLHPAERVLVLDDDQSKIPIGRASKTLSKGLQAARENAWFDSPVMSRDHAELAYDTETSKLSIRDIGSMHGTFVNGTQVFSKTDLDGDARIVLGAEVRRGRETFPACAFHLKYHLIRPESKPAGGGYSFPDMSDMEDAGLSESSDMEDEVEHNSNDGISVTSSRPELSGYSKMIDLTGDDNSDQSSVHSEDLTHVSESKFDPEEVVMDTGSRKFVKDHNEPASARTSGYKATGYAYDNVDERVFDDCSIIDVDDSSARSSESEEEGSNDDEEERNEASDQEDTTSICEISENEDDMSIADSEGSALVNQAIEVPSSMIYDQELDSEMSEADSVDDDEELDNLSPLPSIKDHLRALGSYDSPQSCPQADLAGVTGNLNSVIENYCNPPSASCTSGAASNNVFNNSPFGQRAPSPSDVVFPKSSQWQAHRSEWSPFEVTSKILGVGTAKEEFFKARAENKAAFKQNATNTQNVSNGVLDAQQALPDGSRRILKLRLKAPYRKTMQQVENNADMMLDHEISDLLHELAEEEAGSFVESELAALLPELDAGVDNNISHPADIHRPVISINDIINRATPEIAAPVPKRKADEISTTLEAEINAWASTPSSGTDLLAAQEHVPVVAIFSGLATHEHIITERPRKRLRRVMEKMGYAALGGVAVGAALFGSLVATAPDFV